MRRRSGGCVLAGLACVLLVAAVVSPARAEDGIRLVDSPGLVRGGAPLPQFNTSFPTEIGKPDPVGAAKNDLNISLTTPNHNVLHFLFSPRSLAGETPSIGAFGGTSYAGLAWNLFDSDRLYSSFALSGAIDHWPIDGPMTQLYGPQFSIHSTLELGYSFDPRQTLWLDLDHASPAPYFGDRNVPAENLRLQYGYHF